MHFFSKYDFANRLNYPSSCLKCHSPIYLRINKNSRLQKKLLKKRISMNIYHHFFFDSFFLKQNFKIVFKSQKSFRTLGIIKNCFFPRNKSFRIACNNCKVIMRTFPFSGHITTNGHCICLVDMRRYFHDTLFGGK